MLVDPPGRLIDHLRISLTDRCNFRCRYCYPPTGGVELRTRLLDLDEFTRVARIGIGLGIHRIKLTGGEPLLSPHVITLTGRLAAMSGLEDLSLTTNGSRLRLLAGPLHDAGLRRINLSVDSLVPERFAEICLGGDLREVLAGFREARRVGIEVKINTVALRGWNADEVGAFARFAGEEDVEVRFIEFMPLCGRGWDKDQFVSAGELRERLERHTTLEPLPSDGVARRYRTGTGARIGFIPTMSEPFCAGCRRIRLTAWGALRPCLFSDREVDLRGLLRGGADDEAVAEEFRRAVREKPARNPVLDGADGSRLLIRSVGG
jgi:GTP 3',8-cyclase